MFFNSRRFAVFPNLFIVLFCLVFTAFFLVVPVTGNALTLQAESYFDDTMISLTWLPSEGNTIRVADNSEFTGFLLVSANSGDQIHISMIGAAMAAPEPQQVMASIHQITQNGFESYLDIPFYDAATALLNDIAHGQLAGINNTTLFQKTVLRNGADTFYLKATVKSDRLITGFGGTVFAYSKPNFHGNDLDQNTRTIPTSHLRV